MATISVIKRADTIEADSLADTGAKLALLRARTVVTHFEHIDDALVAWRAIPAPAEVVSGLGHKKLYDNATYYLKPND